MAIKTRKEVERTKKESTKVEPRGTDESSSPVSVSTTPAKILPKTFILQDPDSRSFKDTIILEGKKIEREVIRGKLTTQEEILKTFLVNKGWILLDTFLDSQEV